MELRGTSELETPGISWYVNGEVWEEAAAPYLSSLPSVPGEYVIEFGTEDVRSEAVKISIR